MAPSDPRPESALPAHGSAPLDVVTDGFDGLADSVDRVLALARESMQRLGCAFFRLHSLANRATANHGAARPADPADPAPPRAGVAALDEAVAESMTCLQFEDLLTQMLTDVQGRLAALREIVEAPSPGTPTEGGDEARWHELRAQIAGRSASLHGVDTRPGAVEIF